MLNISYEKLLEDIGILLDQKLEEKLEEKLEVKLNQKFDERLAPIIERLDLLEFKQDKMNDRLENMELDVKGLEVSVRRSEKNIMREIAKLKDADDTLVAVLQNKGILPSVQANRIGAPV